MDKILIIDDDESMRIILKRMLDSNLFDISLAENGLAGLQQLENVKPDIVVTDLVMPDVDGIDILKRMKEVDENVPVIILTAYDEMSSTIKAIQLGAFDYLSKPVEEERLKLLVKRALENKNLHEKCINAQTGPPNNQTEQYSFIGHTQAVKEIFKQIGQVSVNRVTVFIQGESGTGKELVSRIIHNSGITADKPFVAVNCSALSETLLESELFGHAKGSFTGAIRDKKGKFELAGEGTIFLDEISEISLNLQVKLLRVIQEKEFEKVGGDEPIPLKARIITSSNRNLAEMVQQGKFREDLFYRLKVFTITLPPLRERVEDIPKLVIHFLAKINSALHKNVTIVPYDVMEMLQNYDWVGNVRELENILTQAIVLAKSNVLEKDLLILKRKDSPARNLDNDLSLTLAEVERNYIQKVLEKNKWNKSEAAKVLDIAKSTLYKKIEEYKIVKEE